MKQIMKLTIIATAFAASTLAVSGAVITYDGTTFSPRGDGPFTIGNLIEIGSTPITINALGAQDLSSSGNGAPASDGFFGDVTVGVWTADGSSLLGSVTIPASGAGSTLIDTYRYMALSPDLSTEITLAANTDYLIGATVGAGIEWFTDAAAGPYTGDGVTILESRFSSTLGAAPTSAGGLDPGRWAPANATFVPEPGTSLLAGLAGMGLLLRRRRH
jgi:hypothetical protein